MVALRFTNGRADWRDRYWVRDLPDLSERERVTVQRIIEAADITANIMRTGGSKEFIV